MKIKDIKGIKDQTDLFNMQVKYDCDCFQKAEDRKKTVCRRPS